MRRARLLNPLTWFKLAASMTALVANAIQLSEMANENGYPVPGKEGNWHALARMVAFEGRALRRHVGALE